MGHALLTHDHSLLGVQVALRPGDPEQWELKLWGSSKLGAQLGEGAFSLYLCFQMLPPEHHVGFYPLCVDSWAYFSPSYQLCQPLSPYHKMVVMIPATVGRSP